jgi:hypothetical protein
MRDRVGNSEVGRLMEALAALGQDVRITVTSTKKAAGEMEGAHIVWNEADRRITNLRAGLQLLWSSG